MSDADLVDRTKQGDLEAFNRLAQRWNGGLYGFSLRVLGNPDDARDVCQDALIKAYTNIGRLREPAKFKSWLFHIAMNLCRDRKRSPRHRADLVSLDERSPAGKPADRRTSPAIPPDMAAHRAGVNDKISEVLSHLTAEQRTAILLKEYEGFTSEEIGEITGVPAATVRTRIYYGLKAVRRQLEEKGVDHDALT